MSTRAAIGIQKSNFQVLGAYVHYDGYPEYTLHHLSKFYSVPIDAESVVNLGGIKLLEPRIEKVVQISPGRPILFNNLKDFIEHFRAFYCEYFYLYTPLNKWKEVK